MTGKPPAPERRREFGSAYRCLVGVGALCALLIVTVRGLTQPLIAERRAVAREHAVLSVLPGSVASRDFELDPSGGFRPVEGQPQAPDSLRVYAGYAADGHFVGVALEASGMGYQDAITLLYGYDPGHEVIVGMSVLESRETPGLGSRVGEDPVFLGNFTALDVRLASDGQLVHPIESVASGRKTSPWQVDAITGATVSSRAITKILRESSARWLSRVRAHQKDFVP